MGKRRPKANAVKLDEGDVAYLLEIIDWAEENEVISKKDSNKARRWANKPWPKAWSSYACKSCTAQQAYDNARLCAGAAVLAWIHKDKKDVEVLLVNKGTINEPDYSGVEVIMYQRNINIYEHEVFTIQEGMCVVTEVARRKENASNLLGPAQWDKFCKLLDEALYSGDWQAMTEEQHSDYVNNGAMQRVKPWLDPVPTHKFIEPEGIYIQKPGAFQRIKAREKAKEK